MFLRILISRVVSSGCNPTLGSSNTYIEPTKALPRDVARLILCVSPPESVFDFLFKVKYERPTSLRKVNLLTISSIILLLFFLSDSDKDNSLKNFKFFSTFYGGLFGVFAVRRVRRSTSGVFDVLHALNVRSSEVLMVDVRTFERNEAKRNETKRNETKRNETKRHGTKKRKQ